MSFKLTVILVILFLLSPFAVAQTNTLDLVDSYRTDEGRTVVVKQNWPRI